MSAFGDRMERLRGALADREWQGALLTPSGDMEYISGIHRRPPAATESHMHGDWLAGVLITADTCTLIAPHLAYREMEASARDKPWIDEVVHIPEGADLDRIARRLFDQYAPDGGTLALPRTAKAQTMLDLGRLFPALVFRPSGEILGPMRAIKEAGEIQAMKRAAAVADEAFAGIVPLLRPGMSEWDIKLETERQLRLAGAEGTSFETGIMIRGEGCDGPLEGVSATRENRLEPGRVLAFDFGAVVDGYASDFGRTVFVGDPDAELLRIHDLIVEAQAEGMRALRPGTPTAEVDARARSVIEGAGYGEAFFHRLGHGIGIDVHEAPFLAPGDTGTVQADMCFTVEPSVLIPGRCFVRIEDVVRATPEGGVSLNETPREPVII